MLSYTLMEKEVILQKIKSAYRSFLSRDSYLCMKNSNERSMTHKLAEYLQQQLPDWNVDCEYNKNLGGEKLVQVWEEKRKELIAELEKEITNRKLKLICNILDGGITVYPDIIVHHRGTDENLLVIEAKKVNYSGYDFDGQKLQAYKSNLHYKYAYKILFPETEVNLRDVRVDDCLIEI